MTRDPDGLVARIRQIRRAPPTPDVRTPPEQIQAAQPYSGPLEDLQARITHLEQMVQGLQDSVYREAQREEGRIAELEARTEPAALAAALSKHARERGL